MASPKRQSCDRCHSQKLQCVRSNPDATASCVRCVRQGVGVKCVYSTPLPKGRRRKDASSQVPIFIDSSTISQAPSALSPTTQRLSASSEDRAMAMVDQDVYQFDAYDSGFTMPFRHDENHVNSDWMQVTDFTCIVGDIAPLDDSEGCAKRLLDLSSRLYSTYRASLSFQTLSAMPAESLVTTASFEAAYAALFESFQVSEPNRNTGFDTIHDIFTASRSLLDIVSQCVSAFGRTSPNVLSSNDQMVLQAISAQSCVPPTTGRARAGRSNRSADFHLVIACYSLLLHTYSELIASLHVEAASHNSADASALPPTSAELRLALVIQLITCLLGRLQNTMHMYSANLDSSIAELETKARNELRELQKLLKDTHLASR